MIFAVFDVIVTACRRETAKTAVLHIYINAIVRVKVRVKEKVP